MVSIREGECGSCIGEVLEAPVSSTDRSLQLPGELQMSLFDEHNLAESPIPDYPDEQLISP
jgi:hypothetical protein